MCSLIELKKSKKMKTLMIAIMGCLLLSGCGNGWEMTKKNFKSNYSELPRKVVVYDSFKAETIWEFTGIVYMSDDSRVGNVSIIYKKGGEYYKNDFVGQHINVYMIE